MLCISQKTYMMCKAPTYVDYVLPSNIDGTLIVNAMGYDNMACNKHTSGVNA